MSEPHDLGTGAEPVPITESVPTGEDDFFCLRYRVWYRSFDCAIRTRFETAPGCLRCDQGRFNLKRHEVAIRGVRWRLAAGD